MNFDRPPFDLGEVKFKIANSNWKRTIKTFKNSNSFFRTHHRLLLGQKLQNTLFVLYGKIVLNNPFFLDTKYIIEIEHCCWPMDVALFRGLHSKRSIMLWDINIFDKLIRFFHGRNLEDEALL